MLRWQPGCSEAVVRTDRGQAALALAAASLLHLWLLSSVRLEERQPVSYSQSSVIRLRTSTRSAAGAVPETETAPAQTAAVPVPERRAPGALKHDRTPRDATEQVASLASPAASTRPEESAPLQTRPNRPVGATSEIAAATPPAMAPAPQRDTPGSSSGAAASYEQVLARWIDRFKIYPPVARRRREEGQVLVRVRIARSGRLLGESLARSTEYPMLDRAALDSVRRAAPFPPLPEDLAGETREFLVPFVFTID